MQGPKSTNKRRVNAYCLASIKMAEDEKRDVEKLWK